MLHTNTEISVTLNFFLWNSLLINKRKLFLLVIINMCFLGESPRLMNTVRRSTGLYQLHTSLTTAVYQSLPHSLLSSNNKLKDMFMIVYV